MTTETNLNNHVFSRSINKVAGGFMFKITATEYKSTVNVFVGKATTRPKALNIAKKHLAYYKLMAKQGKLSGEFACSSLCVAATNLSIIKGENGKG